MAVRFVRPSPHSAARGLDLLPQLTAVASLALFTWALIERPLRGWSSPSILAAIAAAAVGVAAFVRLERRSESPVLPLHLFADRTFSSTALAALLYAGSFFGSVLVLSLDFQEIRGDSPAAAGLHLTAITVSFGLTSVVAGRLAARSGTKPLIVSGLGILAAGAGWAAVIPTATSFLFLAPALVLMGVGAGLVAPSMNAAILASVPAALSGIGAGVLNASRQIGTALAVAIFASLFHGQDKAAAVRLCLAWAAAVYLAALALSLRSTTTSRYSLGSTSVPSPERLPRSISSSRSRSNAA